MVLTVEYIQQKLKKIDALLDVSDYSDTLNLCEEALSEAQSIEYIEGQIIAYQKMSHIFFYKADYTKAYECSVKAGKLLDEIQQFELELENYISFAELYIRQSDYEEAVRLLKNGLKKALRKDDIEYEILINNYLGEAYYSLGQYDSSEKILTEVLKKAQKYGRKQYINDVKINLAQVFLLKGQYIEAKKNLDDVMHYAELINNNLKIVKCNLIYASIAFERKDYNGTIHFANQAEELSLRLNLNYELSVAYELTHKSYAEQDQYKEAYEALLKFQKITCSIINNEKEKSLARMRIKYDVYQKEKEAEILKQKNRSIKKQREELERLTDVLGKQNEDLHATAIKDYLTGTYNRKYFMFKFEEEFSIAWENGTDISCLIFDVDKFKSINDTFGHLIGDEVIKNIVMQVSGVVDESAIIGRFGGDEFVVILLGVNLKRAKDTANKVLESVRAAFVVHYDTLIRATISIGVTDNKIGHPQNAEDMIRYADKALYKAKENGRNQYSIAE